MTRAFSSLGILGRQVHKDDPRRLVLIAALLVLLGVIFPAYLGIELTRGLRLAPGSTYGAGMSWAGLMESFNRQGFELAEGAERTEAPLLVPRVFVAELPHDWRDLNDPGQRKRVFTTVLLPLVLRANEILFERRSRLLEVMAQSRKGARISARDRAWLLALAEGYDVEATEVTDKLLIKLKGMVDIVPPSLAIAQAAIESGWGTSRFAAEGNALYGQWAEEGEGAMVPAERDAGRTYAIKSFDSLQDSVLAYMHNLNTHRAYRAFRAARAKMREKDRRIAGDALARHLGAYSERGERYIRDLNAIMSQNGLAVLDGAALRARPGKELVTTSGPV